MTGQLPDDRQHSAQFFSFLNGHSARTARLSAHINYLRPFSHLTMRLFHRLLRAEKTLPIRKGVGRYINDAHDQRWARKGKPKLARAKNHVKQINNCEKQR